MEAGARGAGYAPALGGVLGGAVTIVPMAIVARDDAFVGAVVILAVIAGAYIGFAASDGRPRAGTVEGAGVLAFGLVAWLSYVADSGLLLAAGYIAHGAWDMAHHPRLVDTAVARWYPPFCLVYDVVVGAFVLVRFA